MKRSEALACLRLSMTQGLHRASRRLLCETFPNLSDLFSQSPSSLTELGLSREETDRLLSPRTGQTAEQSLDLLLNCGGKIISWSSPDYPQRLRQTSDPPTSLYLLGTLPPVDTLPVIAMVGTRRCDEAGSQAARQIAGEIVSLGGLICTGLAGGIDRCSAEGALAQGGRVLGVLGTSIDQVYPLENRDLFEAVRENGCILSEYPPLYGIGKKGFPARNRIIAGLSLGVVVVQAPEKSGSLITADHAASEGRDVFAVPGSIGDGLSQGSNRLLSDGAVLVQSGRDVMRSYLSRPDLNFLPASGEEKVILPAAAKPRRAPAPRRKCPPAPLPRKQEPAAEVLATLTEDQLKIVSALSGQEKHIDDIILETGLTASRALSELTLLQLKGVAVQAPGKRFSLNIKKA